jgi:hypothetical protein
VRHSRTTTEHGSIRHDPLIQFLIHDPDRAIDLKRILPLVVVFEFVKERPLCAP